MCLCQTGELSYQRYLNRRYQALIIAHYILITVQITLLFAVPFGGQESSPIIQDRHVKTLAVANYLLFIVQIRLLFDVPVDR